MGETIFFNNSSSSQIAVKRETENIRKILDDRNNSDEVFVDLQKSFFAGDHQILLGKLNYYDICGVSSDCGLNHI